jgi:hypothetical protein
MGHLPERQEPDGSNGSCPISTREHSNPHISIISLAALVNPTHHLIGFNLGLKHRSLSDYSCSVSKGGALLMYELVLKTVASYAEDIITK